MALPRGGYGGLGVMVDILLVIALILIERGMGRTTFRRIDGECHVIVLSVQILQCITIKRYYGTGLDIYRHLIDMEPTRHRLASLQQRAR